MRTIYLPALEKSVSLGAYVRAVKLAKANPDVEFKHGLTCWWPCTGAEILEQFRRGMDERIAAGISYVERGLEEGWEPDGEYAAGYAYASGYHD